MTVAVLFDARSYKIPNQLIILGYLAGIYINLTEYGMIGMKFFIIEAAWPIIGLSLLYFLGKQIGAGDVKLYSVMATLVGARMTVDTMITSVMLAGVAILVVSLYERQIMRRNLHFSFYITAGFLLQQFSK